MLTTNLSSGTTITPCDEGPCYIPSFPSTHEIALLALFTVSLLGTSIILPHLLPPTERGRSLISILSGVEHSLGLLLTGLANPGKVLGSFSLREPATFDPSLALVAMFGVLPNLIRNALRGFECPPAMAERFYLPSAGDRRVGWRFLARAAAEGVGWGLVGMGSGSGILRAVVQPGWGAIWVTGFLVGQFLLPY